MPMWYGSPRYICPQNCSSPLLCSILYYTRVDSVNPSLSSIWLPSHFRPKKHKTQKTKTKTKLKRGFSPEEFFSFSFSVSGGFSFNDCIFSLALVPIILAHYSYRSFWYKLLSSRNLKLGVAFSNCWILGFVSLPYVTFSSFE